MNKNYVLNEIQQEILKREHLLNSHVDNKDWKNAARVECEIWGMNYIYGLVRDFNGEA